MQVVMIMMKSKFHERYGMQMQDKLVVFVWFSAFRKIMKNTYMFMLIVVFII